MYWRWILLVNNEGGSERVVQGVSRDFVESGSGSEVEVLDDEPRVCGFLFHDKL
jgi:hypothetical protein